MRLLNGLWQVRQIFFSTLFMTRSILYLMSTATVIYPHQLFASHPGLAPGRPVFLIEEPLFMSEFPIHRQKLILHQLSIEAYKVKLQAKGYSVTVVSLTPTSTTASIFTWLKAHHFTEVHIVDTTDDWLEQRIAKACTKEKLARVSYESPLFLLPKQEAMERYLKSKRHLARFYEQLRRDTKVLMTADGKPQGGRFSFDADNRQKIPKGTIPPADPDWIVTPDTIKAIDWLNTISGEHYGQAKVWLPYTHDEAEVWLNKFITERLAEFGPYEDAITDTHVQLWHSILSPLLNIGLLTPKQIIDATLAYHKKYPIPLPSLEGFIRQVIGWREFIRASYEVDGRKMRSGNFWQHQRSLPGSFWTGSTGLPPLDDTINKTLHYGYTHHIERLMIVGNFMLLSEIHPDEVYRWFMAMYVDAYDWVMVPNVYGMSQFADGGLFATKPYISGSNYLRKMSNYKVGDWSVIWDALYWNFIAKNQAFFLKNHRLSMMPHLLAKMDTEKRTVHLTIAKEYLDSHL